MNKVSRFAVSAAFVLASASSAYAGCGISSGSVKILANDFPAMQAIAGEATSCDGGGASVSANLNADYKDLIVPGFTSNPPEFTTSHNL